MGEFNMSRRKLKSIDIDFFKKNKQLTFYLMMIIFLIALLISKLNFSYGSSTKAYISDNVLIDMSMYKIKLKKQKVFRINKDINDIETKTKIVCVYEYEIQET